MSQHVLKLALTLILALLTDPAWALEDCNVNPQGMQDISKALQCLDRNIKSLAQTPGGRSPVSPGSVSLSGKYTAGVYTSPDGKKQFKLSGPTKLGDREKWTLNSDDGTIDLSWITGPPNGHPTLLGTKLMNELSAAYDYGRVGKQATIDNNWWIAGHLIGATPSSDGLTVSRFHNSSISGYPDELTESASFSVRLSKDGR